MNPVKCPSDVLTRIENTFEHRFPGAPYLEGTCNICGLETRFFSDSRGNYRESLHCAGCLTNSRYRSIARGILKAIRELSGIEASSISRLNRHVRTAFLTIYDTQIPFYYPGGCYPIPDLLSRFRWIHMRTSINLPDQPPGAHLGVNRTNQNLEHTTFPDNTFDIVITSDLMEHVRLDQQAHREIRRILKPGGLYLFTVPHSRDVTATSQRVIIHDPADPDQDQFVGEKEYHGDPNSIDGRSLCYRIYGLELDDDLEKLGFEVNYDIKDYRQWGIMKTELFYCRLRKN